MNMHTTQQGNWSDDDMDWIYPVGLPVPTFDREKMRTSLMSKCGMGLSDQDLDLVIYDNVVYHAKNHKRLILGFVILDAGFQPILSNPIDNIQQRWKESLPICEEIVKQGKQDWNTAMRELML